jgi:hypothetical protein
MLFNTWIGLMGFKSSTVLDTFCEFDLLCFLYVGICSTVLLFYTPLLAPLCKSFVGHDTRIVNCAFCLFSAIFIFHTNHLARHLYRISGVRPT